MRTTLAVVGLVVSALGTAHAATANDVAEWNEVAVTVLLAGGQNNLTLTRGLTMVSVAVHDALNAIQRRYEPYAFDGAGEPSATPEAAVATAARDVLVLAVPVFGTASQQAAAIAMADTAYTAALARIADGPGKTSGIAVGRAAAAAIVGLRRDDGATREVPYTPGTDTSHPSRSCRRPSFAPPGPRRSPARRTRGTSTR